MNSAIWFIDDDEAEHEMFRLAFEAASAPVTLRDFFSAEEAVAAMMRGESPSLILLDLNMPGLGGYHLLEERSRQAFNYVPVVVLSSSSNPDDIRRSYASGANAYLEKPADFDELTEFAERVRAFWFETAHLPPPNTAETPPA